MRRHGPVEPGQGLSLARPADPALANDYDSFAGAYSAETENNLVHAYYARPAMPALARRRLGDDVALHRVDLSDRLPFADGAFDDVAASLVLHHLEDWGPTPAEIRRVLGPGGRLIASVDHPFVTYTIQDSRPDYFATTGYTRAAARPGHP
ncbi:hypothetical protein BIV25_28205 [Streptomyces sp. MUSC 14]|nr:hypothetical protein BIV25_28205 [Streptomyces sp. MUSC 14]